MRGRLVRACSCCLALRCAGQTVSGASRGAAPDLSRSHVSSFVAGTWAMDRRGILRSSDGGASPNGTRPRLPTGRPVSGQVSTVGLLPGAGGTLGAGNTDPCTRSGAPHSSDSSEPATGTQLAATGGSLVARALLGHSFPQPVWTAHYPFRHRAAACIAWSFATLEEAAAFTGAIRQRGTELGRSPIPGAATVSNASRQ